RHCGTPSCTGPRASSSTRRAPRSPRSRAHFGQQRRWRAARSPTGICDASRSPVGVSAWPRFPRRPDRRRGGAPATLYQTLAKRRVPHTPAMTSNAYDAIVVGARCAGAPTAMLLAEQGHRVLLVDRSTFPSDTLSTLVIQPMGVAALRRWGLFEQIAATG